MGVFVSPAGKGGLHSKGVTVLYLQWLHVLTHEMIECIYVLVILVESKYET